MQDEIRYKIFKLLEEDPALSQRELAQALDVSLGKLNYCLRALIDKGWVKAGNFKQSKNRKAYMYLLTPRGLEEKVKVTLRFFDRKLKEHEELTKELEIIRQEALKLKD